MNKAIYYSEGSATAGNGESLAVICAAPWQGILKCVEIHVEAPTIAGAGDIIIKKHHRNGLAEWVTELFAEDPSECDDAFNIVLTTPIALKFQDSITVEYANPDDVSVTCQITLECV